MKIALLSTNLFGYECFKTLLTIKEITVEFVFSQQNEHINLTGPNQVKNVRFFNFKDASQLAVPIISMSDSKDFSNLEMLFKEQRIDAALVIGWYSKIPDELVNNFPFYAIHASLLPQYSGWSPLTWSLINGEKKTGVTLFKMTGAIDAGPIIAQSEIRISKKENVNSLYSKSLDAAKNILIENLPKISSGNFNTTYQDENMRTVFPARTPLDGEISFYRNPKEVVRFINAQLPPLPGAFFRFKRNVFFIYNANSINFNFIGNSGDLYIIVSKVVIKCSQGYIILNEISYQDKIYKYSEIARLFRRII
jgi:methionyl-tRNA formyltransferase